jgi:hypothetical protein
MALNYQLTIIIPTIWSSSVIYRSVEKLQKLDIVGEIIIINNRPNACKQPISGEKVRMFDFQENLYVNAAWNFGVSKASFEKICILNDDVLMDDLGFYYAIFLMDNPQVGILGISKECLKQRSYYRIEQISVRNRGYGTVMFLRKSEYTPIPDDMRIWFGDDWLIKHKEGRVCRMVGPYVETVMSTSSGSPEFQKVIDEDVQNSIKYNLPWSSDFE